MHPLRSRLASLFFALNTAAACAQTAPLPATPTCTGLCLQQVSCPGNGTTTISGKVYAPNGTDPIPNVTVYVPNAPVAAFTSGISCPVPGQLPSGAPLIGTFSAADGSFTLANAPVGPNVPLVIVAGKWRRQFVIPGTIACANTAFDARLPRNQSEGDIPKFAVSTGDADQVECVLRKVGIDDAEFTNPGGNGRIQLYQSTLLAGARVDPSTPSANSLMGVPANLNSYDVLMLPCEGAAHTEAANQLSNLVSYTNGGGRVYASHFAYEWLWKNPPFDTVADWTGSAAQQLSGTATVNQNFASGATLAQWLQIVGASTTLGQIDLSTIRFDISGIRPPTQAWLNLNQTGNPAMQFTFDTPVGQTSGQCGRVLFNEYHVENNGTSRNKAFPSECPPTAAMTPQEKLLEYSLFDLANDGGPASLTPTNADFGNQVLNFPSASKPFIITNNSVFSTSLTSVTVTDDFLVTGNSCTSVPAGGSCTLNLAFKPTSLGAHTGKLTALFGGATLLASLSGTGVPTITTQTSSLDFGSTDVGTTLQRSFVLTNNATGPVALPTFRVTGDYLTTNSCGASIPGGSTCVLTVRFTPSTYGPRPGTLTAASNDPAYSAINEQFTGNGLDFGIAIQPIAETIIAGLQKMPAATATPLGGFSAPVTYTCSTDAPATTCTINPNPAAIGTAPVTTLPTATLPLTAPTTLNLNIATTSEYTLAGYGIVAAPWVALFSAAGALGLFFNRKKCTGISLFTLLLVGALSLTLSGCSGKLPSRNPTFTPVGSYTMTLSATDGTITHTATYAMKVIAR